MLNSFSVILALAGAFLGADRYYFHFQQLAALPLYLPTALSLLGMLLGFLGTAGKKSKKKRRAPMACAVINLIVCLLVTGLWLAQVLLGKPISFG